MYSVGAIGLILFELSTLFKIQHWPGAGVMLMLGAILIVTVFFPMYAMSTSKKVNYVSEKFIYATIVIAFFLLLGSLINMNFSKNVWGSLSNTNYYAQIESGYFKTLNDNLVNDFAHNNIDEIHLKADEICDFIYNIKKELIILSQNVNETEAHKYLQNIRLLANKDANNVVNNLFFEMGDKSYAAILKNQLSDYKKMIIENQPQLETDIEKLINLEDINNHGEIQTWEKGMFYYSPVYITMIQLSNITRNVRAAENLIYSDLSLKKEIENENMMSNL